MHKLNKNPDSAEKWNERYRTDTRFSDAPVRSLVRLNSNLLPSSGRALEIAGGLGKTTDFLQRSGLDVVELDISLTALKHAQSVNSLPNYIVADVRHFPLVSVQFDVICNFYFLDRDIFQLIDRYLLPGGLLFFETMTIEMQTIKPDMPSEKLLQPGELRSVFNFYKFLYYFEGWTDSDHGKKKAIAQLIARKPDHSV